MNAPCSQNMNALFDWDDEWTSDCGATCRCPMCGGEGIIDHSLFRGPYPDRLHHECMECGLRTNEPCIV